VEALGLSAAVKRLSNYVLTVYPLMQPGPSGYAVENLGTGGDGYLFEK
jgi:hypothetical protein